MTTKISTKRFHFDKEHNEFSQEISSMGGQAIYNTIELVSHKTGATVPFELGFVEQSDEGEILCWNYTAKSPFQILQNLTLVIFND